MNKPAEGHHYSDRSNQPNAICTVTVVYSMNFLVWVCCVINAAVIAPF